MDDFSAHLKTASKISLFFLSVCCLLWAVLPGYRPYTAGLILGVAVSTVNAQYLAWKIRMASEAVIQKSNRRVNLGYMTRAALSLLAIVVTLKSNQFALSTTMAGLFFMQLVTLLLGIISNQNKK